jgi:phosphate acetyltransferase
VQRGLCKVTVICNPQEVNTVGNQLKVDLSDVNIVDPGTSSDTQRYADMLYEARKEKGMTPEKALDLVTMDPNYYGTMMMFADEAHGMVSGACHTTADTMRPALQIIKTAPGCSLVSSVFFMLLPEQVFVYGDCAINVNPDSQQLADIAVSSANTAKAFGIKPRVALLSYATGDSNSGDLITKVKEGCEKAQAMATEQTLDFPIEGPLQFDAAVDPEVAKVKVKTASEVAGRANVCVFPDLNTGNNAYKAVQQASGCIAMGPIMQGLKKPVNDLSRGCTVDDIVNTVVITCIQSL